MEALSPQLYSPAEEVKGCGVFHPSVWGDYFITHSPLCTTELERIESRIKELNLKLSRMLTEATSDHQALVLIDTLQRLGVAYLLETEINNILIRIHRAVFSECEDLLTIALGFRLLRQHGLDVSPDVLSKFLDKDGDVVNDGSGFTHSAEALLGLYEAAHFGTPGEKILERAAQHARTRLKSMEGELQPYMAEMVSRALQFSRLKGMERLEERKYISIYELHQNRIEMLLEFAKLDFQRVQSIHQKELRHLSLWKNEFLEPAKKFPFARDRLVELHFWIVGAYFEPCYSRARIFATKMIFLVSILDDIYDQYGTAEDLQLLTETLDKWELNGVQGLPEYLQDFFSALFRTVEELENELELEQASFRLHYLKEAMKMLANAYHEETIWGGRSFVPTVEEYLKVSLRSSVIPFFVCLSYIGIEKVISRDVFEWLSSFPEVVMASATIVRIMNDLVKDEHERKEKHVAGAVQCYVKQHKCAEEEAREKLTEMVERAWRVINQFQ